MFDEIHYCYSCKFWVAGYCKGEKRLGDDYACEQWQRRKSDNNEMNISYE